MDSEAAIAPRKLIAAPNLTVETRPFVLPKSFVREYEGKQEPWKSYGAAEGLLASSLFLSRYSRLSPIGDKEQWVDVCHRVTEGTFSVLKTHCAVVGSRWPEAAMLARAHHFFDSLFALRFSPAGRGLHGMGVSTTSLGSAASLNSCGFIATDSPLASVPRMLDAAILGVGIGFDVRGSRALVSSPAPGQADHFPVRNDRSSWVGSVSRLLRSYFAGDRPVTFEYFDAPGSDSGFVFRRPPIELLHQRMRLLLESHQGSELGIRGVVDLMNFVGVCVTADNQRRGAQLALGPAGSEFLTLKQHEANPIRNDPTAGWGWVSNNTVIMDQTTTDIRSLVDLMAENGEPGMFWRERARRFGRLADPETDGDSLVAGINPCGEQTLENGELCVLAEIFPTRHDKLSQVSDSAQHAFLYGKAVTLLATGWTDTDEVIARNRRVGCSMTGLAELVDRVGLRTLRSLFDSTYQNLRDFDTAVSRWLNVPVSVKRTSIKPSGSLSLLAGTTAGVHWPVGQLVRRRVRFASDPLIAALEAAGCRREPGSGAGAGADVIAFDLCYSVSGSDREVSLQRRLEVAVLAQRWWADNGVSFTLTFDPHSERDLLVSLLDTYHTQLKSISVLPHATDSYGPLPCQPLGPGSHSQERPLMALDWSDVARNMGDAEYDAECSAGACTA